MEFNGGEMMQYFYSDVLNLDRIIYIYNRIFIEVIEYVYEFNGNLIVMKRSGNVYYIVCDFMGFFIVIINKIGYIVKLIVYNFYGKVENDINLGFEFSFGFQGGLYNSVIELVIFKNRVYDIDNGRWLCFDYSLIFYNIQKIMEDFIMLNNYRF